MLKPSGVATCSIGWFSQSPFASRNVLTPLSAETPAPVSTSSRVPSSIRMAMGVSYPAQRRPQVQRRIPASSARQWAWRRK